MAPVLLERCQRESALRGDYSRNTSAPDGPRGMSTPPERAVATTNNESRPVDHRGLLVVRSRARALSRQCRVIRTRDGGCALPSSHSNPLPIHPFPELLPASVPDPLLALVLHERLCSAGAKLIMRNSIAPPARSTRALCALRLPASSACTSPRRVVSRYPLGRVPCGYTA